VNIWLFTSNEVPEQYREEFERHLRWWYWIRHKTAPEVESETVFGVNGSQSTKVPKDELPKGVTVIDSHRLPNIASIGNGSKTPKEENPPPAPFVGWTFAGGGFRYAPDGLSCLRLEDGRTFALVDGEWV
jgi:hypothetical protein